MESCSSTPSPKFDFYQSPAKVVITILVKNVSQDGIQVNFAKDIVSARIKLPSNEEHTLNFNLWQTIVPEKCTYKVMPSKVEIYLAKDSAVQWESLEKKVEVAKPKPCVKNWDALAKTLVSEKDEEASIDSMFGKIYSDGSDEQKRAMLKSFYESGGTVLSTDWKEVSKQKVEVKPPEGVEFKPWNN